jgi:hypothetical protein
MAGMDGKIGLGAPGPIVPSVRKPCPMNRTGSKESSSLSDSLSKALGLPPIEPHPMQLTRVKLMLNKVVPMASATHPISPYEDTQPTMNGSWLYRSSRPNFATG